MLSAVVKTVLVIYGHTQLWEFECNLLVGYCCSSLLPRQIRIPPASVSTASSSLCSGNSFMILENITIFSTLSCFQHEC